ncbi:MAG: hypothetical protein ACJ749_06705 [Flavisolibacter sp.]
MMTRRKINTLLLISFTYLLLPRFVHAQKKELRSMWYGGVGLFSPSKTMKESSMLGNGFSWTTGYSYKFGPRVLYLSEKVKTKIGHPASSLRLAIELRVDYSKMPGNPVAPSSASSLRYTNGSTEVQSVSLKLHVKPKKPDAFEYLVGPSLFYEKEKFFLQSSLLIGYASVSQEPFAFYDSLKSASDPAQNRNVIFYTAGHETNNGWVLVPGVKAGIDLTRQTSFFVAFDYSIGSSQHFSDQVFVPEGAPSNGVYSFGQMNNGTLVPIERNGRFRALAISGNLAFKF